MTDADRQTIKEPCPTCLAEADERCRDMAAWLQDPRHPVYLDYLHAERVEAAAFVQGLGHPGDGSVTLPVTPDVILKTGLF